MSIKNESVDQNRLDWVLLFIRVVLAVVFVAHGSQKLFGAFGGPGLAGTVQFMGPIGYLVSIGEFFGGLGLLVGILPRFSAAALTVIMLGAIATVHGKNGFFLPTGFEYTFALIGLTVPMVVLGPGRLTVAKMLPEKASSQVVTQ